MTDPYGAQTPSHAPDPWSPPPTPGPVGGVDSSSSSDRSKTDQAKGAAREVATDAQGAGRAVAETAKSEAASVKEDAAREGRKLWDETTSTLSTQATDQMNRAAGTVRTFTDDLGRMARGEQPEAGLATELTGQLTDRTEALATWLEHHEPADLLDEVQRFARRRPAAFLAIAAGIGFAAGRLTRGVAQNHMDDDDSGQLSGGPRHAPAAPAGAGYGYPATGQVPPPPLAAPVPPVPPAPPAPGAGAPGTHARPGVPQAPPYSDAATPVDPPLPAGPHPTDPYGQGGNR
ncbi:hypothetical protein [Brachybacterium paraconglomeratum]|uniref:hypothetical protein n=1 Tax=Brachybacterium paraconglomeratum TaxID=173362 RepID=UPI00380DAD43